MDGAFGARWNPSHVERVVLPGHLRAFVLDLLDGLPDGSALCHGDFHPANILDSPAGPMIVDWPNVARGDPDADFARTRVVLRFGEPRAGSTAISRCLVGGMRRAFIGRYEAAYRTLRQPDDMALAGWDVVWTAERIGDSTGAVRARLIAKLDSAYRRSRA